MAYIENQESLKGTWMHKLNQERQMRTSRKMCESLGRGAELSRRWMSLKLHNLLHLVVWELTSVENVNSCELNRFQNYFSFNGSVNIIKFSPIDFPS